MIKDSIIERQMGVLRSILGDFANRNPVADEDFIMLVNKYFYFDTKFGWNLFMNAFYIFEDTELAKTDFKKFDLQGPSRHEDNEGEKYLRLYGVLNALYQQYLALINLMELFKIASKKQYTSQLKKTEAIALRNKIASHSANYLEGDNEEGMSVYEISRHDLNVGKIILLKNQDVFETYDLDVAIKHFDKQAEDILNEILTKFIKKKFNNQGKYFEELKKIGLLRNGAIEMGDQIITFV